MAIFKLKENDEWKVRYIKEYNEMQNRYEEKLIRKQSEIELLKKEIIDLKEEKVSLKPKEKQIKDSDIEKIKILREKGLSYSKIVAETKWSKATVSRVLNGLYD